MVGGMLKSLTGQQSEAPPTMQPPQPTPEVRVEVRPGDTPLAAVVKGAAAGAVGTVALTFAMQQVMAMMAQRQPEQDHVPAAAPREPSRRLPGGEQTQGAAEQKPEPTEQFVEKMAAGLFEAKPSEEERQTYAQLIHWSYGSVWGVVHAVLFGGLGISFIWQALLLGTVVWLFGPVLMLPAMRMQPSPLAQPMPQPAINWGLHAWYGLVTVLAYRIISWIVR